MPPFQPDHGTSSMTTLHHRGSNASNNRESGSPLSARGGAINVKNDPKALTKVTPQNSPAATTTTMGSKLRNALFPIYGDEMKKFFLIGSIKFFVILALTLTRDNKDTMVVTSCGAEAIAFLKVSVFEFLIHMFSRLCFYFDSLDTWGGWMGRLDLDYLD